MESVEELEHIIKQEIEKAIQCLGVLHTPDYITSDGQTHTALTHTIEYSMPKGELELQAMRFRAMFKLLAEVVATVSQRFVWRRFPTFVTMDYGKTERLTCRMIHVPELKEVVL